MRKDDTTEIKLSVFDCAGEAGSGIYGLNYWAKMNMQSETSSGYTKTVDFNGGRAVDTYDKNSGESTFTYAANDRLLIVLTGRNIGSDVLKQTAQGLNLKAP